MKLYGILFCERPDRFGETIDVLGCDLSALKRDRNALLDAGPDPAQGEMWVGSVLDAYVVTRPEGASDEDHALWLEVGVPFVKIEARTHATKLGRMFEELAPLGLYFFGAYGSVIKREGNTLVETAMRSPVIATRLPSDPALRIRVRA